MVNAKTTDAQAHASMAGLASRSASASGRRSQPITTLSVAWPTSQHTSATVRAPATPSGPSATRYATPVRLASVRPPARIPASIGRSRNRDLGSRGRLRISSVSAAWLTNATEAPRSMNSSSTTIWTGLNGSGRPATAITSETVMRASFTAR